MANNILIKRNKGIQKNKNYFLSFVKHSKAKKRSKRAVHVNNVDSTINMLLLFG